MTKLNALVAALALLLSLTSPATPTAHADVTIDTGYRTQIPLGYVVEVVSRVTPTSDYGSATVRITVKHFGTIPAAQYTQGEVSVICSNVSCTYDWRVVNDGTIPAEGATLSLWVAPIQQPGTYPFINYTQRTFDGEGKLTWEVTNSSSIEIGWNPPADQGN